ncbi:hypothetical protein [Actinokineospora sp. HUAS TT18]|uniref:hypothetical protein n=1 Tax=Actinokineospora sp. HUAS TT18 TaxID=3447451 RepID=UPI003F524E41
MDEIFRATHYLVDAAEPIRAVVGAESAIVARLVEAWDAKDWPTFGRYTYAATVRPSEGVVEVLCEALLAYRLGADESPYSHTLVTEALGATRSPAAVSALADALWLGWPTWDEWAVAGYATALCLIDDDAARAHLTRAAALHRSLVREIAVAHFGIEPYWDYVDDLPGRYGPAEFPALVLNGIGPHPELAEMQRKIARVPGNTGSRLRVDLVVSAADGWTSPISEPTLGVDLIDGEHRLLVVAFPPSPGVPLLDQIRETLRSLGSFDTQLEVLAHLG